MKFDAVYTERDILLRQFRRAGGSGKDGLRPWLPCLCVALGPEIRCAVSAGLPGRDGPIGRHCPDFHWRPGALEPRIVRGLEALKLLSHHLGRLIHCTLLERSLDV